MRLAEGGGVADDGDLAGVSAADAVFLGVGADVGGGECVVLDEDAKSAVGGGGGCGVVLFLCGSGVPGSVRAPRSPASLSGLEADESPCLEWQASNSTQTRTPCCIFFKEKRRPARQSSAPLLHG